GMADVELVDLRGGYLVGAEYPGADAVADSEVRKDRRSGMVEGIAHADRQHRGGDLPVMLQLSWRENRQVRRLFGAVLGSLDRGASNCDVFQLLDQLADQLTHGGKPLRSEPAPPGVVLRHHQGREGHLVEIAEK